MKPTFLFDKQCPFCQRMVRRWKKHTGDKVVYRPFQEASVDFPEIPLSDFEQTSHLMTDEGVFRGARGIVELFYFIPRRRWCRWGYIHIPFAGFIAEFIYRKISSCRTCAEKMAQVIWGEE
jgi:predicted DCC family thiol-disulfide oxidoreductase YuxK